jgi:hypothetical protein
MEKQLEIIIVIQDTESILNTGHKYGTITQTIDSIRTCKKGKHLNTLEKYHITRSVKITCK